MFYIIFKKINAYILNNKAFSFSLAFAVLFASFTFAAPYTASEAILNPTCPPTDATCYVTLFPSQTSHNGEYLTTNGSGTLSWSPVSGGASAALSNLASVAINTSLVSDTDNTDDLGSALIEWKDIYIDGTAYLDAIDFAGTAITPTGTELNFVDGVTSAIQTQLDAKQGTLTNSAGLLAALSDETGTGVAVFGTTPTFTTSISVGSAGVKLSDDGDGAITFLGMGDGFDEDLILNLDDTTNVGTFTSSTSLATLNFSSIALQESGIGVLNNDEIDASSELLAIMDDETGTGALVFANTPTLVTPVLGAATATSINTLIVGLGAGSVATNTAIGVSALPSNTTGDKNTALGYQTLFTNTNGTNKTAIGHQALYTSNGDVSNSAFGDSALYQNTTGSYNTALGAYALYYHSTGNYNTAVGMYAFNNNDTGANNTALGYSAGYNTSSTYHANNNIFIGYKAADNITGTTTDKNIVIGHNIDLVDTSGDNQLNIGNIIFGTGVSGIDTTIAGSIGIGTSSPSARLHSLATTEQLRLGYDASNYWTSTIGSTGGLTMQGVGTGGALTLSPTSGQSLNISLAGTGDFIVNTDDLFVDTSSGQVLINTATPTTGSLSKLNIVSSMSSDGATIAIAGVHGELTVNPSAGGTQVGNRFVVNNAPTSTANTAVNTIVRTIDNTSLANLVRGLEVTSNAGTNTAGTNTGIRTTGGTFGIQAFTDGSAGSVSLPAAIYGESTGTTQGDILRLYTTTMTGAPQMALFYQDTSAFTGTGLLMDFATGSGTFTGDWLDFQNNNVTKFKVSNDGSVSLGGSGTRGTTAGTNRLDIFDGTAPVGTLTNGISIYSTSGEAYIMDAAGNATLQSPHENTNNYWVFDSKNQVLGTSLLVDMELMMKKLNTTFGWDFVHEMASGLDVVQPAESFEDNIKFVDKIKNWLASTANGITKIFSKEVETENLCVSDGSGNKTCITKSQLDILLQNAGQQINNGTSEDNSQEEEQESETEQNLESEVVEEEIEPVVETEQTPEPEITEEEITEIINQIESNE